MKNQIIFAILILQTCLLIAQKWDMTYGTSNLDEGFQDVIECYDNGYLICGGTGAEPYINLLIKTDINGNLLWEKSIQHNQFAINGEGVSQNSSGEIVVVGALFEVGGPWPIITKFDECGNKLWCRTYIEEGFDWGVFWDVILLENGDAIALARLDADQVYTDQIFLYHINSAGERLWKKSYASEENHPLIMGVRNATKFYKMNDGYMIVGNCYYPNPGNPNTGYLRPLFIRTDNDFKEMWILPFGINYNIIAHGWDVIALSDTTYMGVGSYSYQTQLMYFNNDGVELGYSEILNEDIGPNIGINVTSSIARINDSLYITSTGFGSDQFSASWGEIIIDSAGNVYNVESRVNASGNSRIFKTFDNKFIIGCNYDFPNSNTDIYMYKINEDLEHDTLYPGNYTYDSLCPYQIESGTIDITDCWLITDVGETPTPEQYFSGLNTIPIKAYPNPAKENQLTLSFQNTDHHNNMELRCFDIFGKQVHKEKIYPFQGESILDIHKWPSGMYFVIVYAEGKAVGECKFVVQ